MMLFSYLVSPLRRPSATGEERRHIGHDKARLFRIAQVMMIRFNQARDSSTVRPDLEKFIRRSATAAVTTAAIVLILRICLYTSCMIALAFVQMVSAAKARVENMLSIVRHHKCYIQSTTNAYISESLLQLLDDGRFVLIHTGKSSFQIEPKRKAGNSGSTT